MRVYAIYQPFLTAYNYLTCHNKTGYTGIYALTLNDLECPIQLTVRMSHGLLADSVDTSLAIVYYVVVKQTRCSVKCTISE